MSKNWKTLTVAALASLSLIGCQLTPRTLMSDLPANQQLAHGPNAPGEQPDVPSWGNKSQEQAPAAKQPFVAPKTPMQLVAENGNDKDKGKTKESPTAPGKTEKRKKARNGEVVEFKRDYSELIKKPDTLGFHPRDDHYQKVVSAIRTSFVENVGDPQVLSGIKRELKIFLEQAKVSTKELAQLEGVELGEAYNKIQSVYGSKVNRDLLGYVTINGALDGLKDAYSVLMTPSETSKLKEQLQSKAFGGIGIYIELDRDNGNQLTVFEPIEGSPAASAGLESGDQILEIDGKTTKGISIDIAQSRIRGEVGSKVILKVNRRKQILSIPVERGQIHVVSVSAKMYEGNIAYIRLRAFGADTAEELHKAIEKFKAQGAKGIILDLRNNGGGYIDAAVNVVGEFAPSNTLVVYTIDRDKNKRTYNSKREGGVGVPLVVMINEFSASASEIAAGALRDHKIATLVGDHSFGKGSVQQLYPLESVFSAKGDDSPQLKLTIARFYAPGGDVIDKKGIEPQVVVDMEPRFVGKVAHDIQLKKALELLGGSLPK